MFLEPRYAWAQFHREIAAGLMDPELVKILISLPPQHYKSTLVAVFFPIWYMGHHPDQRIMVVTYSAELAEFHSSRAMEYFQSEKYFRLFGLNIDPNVRGKGHWKIAGHDGFYHAVGIHGLTSGMPVDVLIIDDYYANMKEAFSEAISKSVKSTYSSALCYRLQSEKSKQIISATRWAENDLQGDMIKKDEAEEDETKWWHKYIYPALRNYKGNDWFSGEPLLKSKEFYRMQLKNSSPIEFETEFLCNPVPMGDMMISPEDWEVVPRLPEGIVKKRVRGHDIAYTGTSSSDDSANALIVRVGQEVFCVDADSWVDPWHVTKQREKETMRGDDPGILQMFETNGGQSALVDDFKRDPDLYGRPIFGTESKEKKQVRALPWMLRVKSKQFKMVEGPQKKKVYDQCVHFRASGGARYDGIMDSISKAWEAMGNTVDLSGWT